MTFDPATVPPFPVYNLAISDDDTVTLDGALITPRDGERPTEAGIRACVDRLTTENLDAVRVRAVSPAGEHRMVITATGDVHDTTTPAPAAHQDKPSTRRRVLIIGGALTACLALIAVVGVAIGITVSRSTPEHVAEDTTLPGAGQPLPLLSPPGAGALALWTTPVAADGAAMQLADGSILIIDATGDLRALDPETGQTLWIGRGAPSNLTGMTETTIDGRPVLARADGQTLQAWPRDMTPTPSARIDLGARATVTYAGTEPLIDLGDQTIARLVDATPQRHNLPAGIIPVQLDATTVTGIGDGTIHHIDTDAGTDTTTPFEPPDGAEGAPTAAVGLTETTALAMWPAESGHHGALIDTTTGETLTTAHLPTGLRATDTVTLAPDGSMAAAGRIGILLGEAPAVVDLGDAPDMMHSGTAYLTDSTHTLRRVHITSEGITTDDTYTDTATPISITDTVIAVISERVDTIELYALPRESETTT